MWPSDAGQTLTGDLLQSIEEEMWLRQQDCRHEPTDRGYRTATQMLNAAATALGSGGMLSAASGQFESKFINPKSTQVALADYATLKSGWQSSKDYANESYAECKKETWIHSILPKPSQTISFIGIVNYCVYTFWVSPVVKIFLCIFCSCFLLNKKILIWPSKKRLIIPSGLSHAS